MDSCGENQNKEATAAPEDSPQQFKLISSFIPREINHLISLKKTLLPCWKEKAV